MMGMLSPDAKQRQRSKPDEHDKSAKRLEECAARCVADDAHGMRRVSGARS
jgi:hypothetical protein